MSRFVVVDSLLDAFPADSGFHPYSFATFAYAPGYLEDTRMRDRINRSFRFELSGCSTRLDIYAKEGAPWHTRTVEGLVQAGYDRFVQHGDWSTYRRWLHGRRQQQAELNLLRALGWRGDFAHWPSRKQSRQLREVSARRLSRDTWRRVIDDARNAGIMWSDATLGVSRHEKHAASAASGKVGISLGVVGWNEVSNGRQIRIFVSVNDGSDTRERTTPLPRRLATDLRRELRALGFAPDGARSTKTGKLQTGRVSFEKRVTTAKASVRECARVMAHVTDLLRAKQPRTGD